MILLPETNINEAINIADRIKKCVANIDILSDNISNTISIGAAELNRDDDVESFLKRADDSLYKAKENGRDRVETFNIDYIQGSKELELS